MNKLKDKLFKATKENPSWQVRRIRPGAEAYKQHSFFVQTFSTNKMPYMTFCRYFFKMTGNISVLFGGPKKQNEPFPLYSSQCPPKARKHIWIMAREESMCLATADPSLSHQLPTSYQRSTANPFQQPTKPQTRGTTA